MQYLIAATPGIISGLTLLIVGFIARRMASFVKDSNGKWAVMLESQKNQLKSNIVVRHEEAVSRGYVTPNELESTIRMKESYVALGGNSYIEAIVADMERLPIHGHSCDIKAGGSD